ncbi:hypothetical protein [Tabrizicola sp.]|uniref:hypothetical protein n=1 Tax=Tabrizicola sp. TaxID=2005166 RepID=UPI0027344D68|nr:hypothetical protein [Tabrizicola sp.]MDP3193691.1 hypothetical protein [Tabrizicola sp.]
MTLHVLFTEDGIPGWIGDAPREGSEAIEGLTVDFLSAHRRTARGKWVVRAAPVGLERSAEDLAAAAAADYRAALADRDQSVRAALAVEADPLFFRWQREETTREDWLAAVAAVRARFPRPERL